MRLKKTGWLVSGFAVAALTMLSSFVVPAPASAQVLKRDGSAFLLCRGKGRGGDNYLYIVPQRYVNEDTIGACNIGGGTGFQTFAAAERVACDRMRRLDSPQSWPQTWSNPPAFNLRIRCR